MTTSTLQPQTTLRLPKPARYAMAAGAVLAPLLVLIGLLLSPLDPALEGREFVAELAKDLDNFILTGWLSGIAAFLWVPAVLTLGRVARAHSPTLGLIGMVLAFGLVVDVSLDAYDLSYVGLEAGLDVDTVAALLVAADSLPSGALAFGWLAGLIGLLLIGIAIVRGGRSAPAWAGVALILAPLAIPVTWFSGSQVAALGAWVLLTAGVAGCALTLVTRPDQT